jgi:hypothetical protein
VLPSNWKPATHSRFDTILTWNDRYAGSGKYRKFCWPVTQRSPHVEPVPFGRKKLLVNISANKRSDHPQDLYRERRAAIRHFERAAPEEFDLYGVGWDSPGEPPYPSYRGAIPDKSTVLRRYRFALCYENMRDEPGWVTEKIFDCMRADCVPIYWGAPNVNAYVDPAAFVDRRRFATDRELERFLRAMSEADYERHRAAIRAYLAGTDFARFLSPAFAGTVIGALGLGD